MQKASVPLEYRTDDQARRITLCKRKKGLYKKAEELAQLCGIEVAVCIVGDGCKPAQMVATGSANYHDIASCYRVMNHYTEQVKGQPIETPGPALDSREVLIQQQKELERQRREIEQLRRQLTEARGGAFETRHQNAANVVRPRAKRKLATDSNVLIDDSPNIHSINSMMDDTILSEMTLDDVSDVLQSVGNELSCSVGEVLSSIECSESQIVLNSWRDIDAEIDQFDSTSHKRTNSDASIVFGSLDIPNVDPLDMWVNTLHGPNVEPLEYDTVL